MGNFSKDPGQLLAASLAKGYVGVRVEQNVPLLDRDINLLGDLVGASLRDVVHRYVGDGAALYDDGAFSIGAIDPPGNNFTIGNGTMLVGGLRVTPVGAATYTAQFGVPPLTPPDPYQTRVDTVYLDVWLEDVQSEVDPYNADDVGLPTSTRVKPLSRVRVAEGPPPGPAPGHVHSVLATITRTGPTITAAQIVDERVTRLNLADLIKRVTKVEADILTLQNALKPRFSVTSPLSTRDGYTDRNVVLYGHNFDLGGVVNVMMTVGQTGVSLPVVGEPLPTSITVRITGNAPKGVAKFRVTTTLGWVETDPQQHVFRNWAPATIAENNPFNPGTGLKGNVDPFTITGANLDGPALEGWYREWGNNPGNPTWYPLALSNVTPTSVVAVSPPVPKSYLIRLRTEANADWSLASVPLVVSSM